MPLVATTTALCGPRPVANAFGIGELTMPTLGIGIPASCETFLTMLNSVGFSCSWMMWARAIFNTNLAVHEEVGEFGMGWETKPDRLEVHGLPKDSPCCYPMSM